MCYFGDSDWRDSSFTILTDSETEVENEESVEIDLLRDVIDVLKQQNEENPRGEMNAVIENYQDRLKRIVYRAAKCRTKTRSARVADVNCVH